MQPLQQPPASGIRRPRLALPVPRRTALTLLAAVPLLLSAFAIVTLVWTPAFGPILLLLTFEVQCFLVAFAALVPIALLARSRRLWAALAVALVVASGRFGPDWVSLPADARSDMTVMTWNLEVGARSPAATVESLLAVDADVIALEEIVPEQAAAIEGDAALTARFPYRYLVPRHGTEGLGVLSRFPIGERESRLAPASLELGIETPGSTVTLFVAHPLPDFLQYLPAPSRPAGAEPFRRDADIARLRRYVDAALARSERVLVVGDFNTTPTEAAYRVLTAGLRDLHTEVGQGPGWTWRPSSLDWLDIAVLRIDLQLSAGITPAWTQLDCSHPGDHCQLFGGYRLD